MVLTIPNKTNGDANDRLNDGLNDRLNGSLMATYTIVRSNPGIQRKDISDISGKSIPTIDRHIAILMKKGLIEHRDSKKTGGYYAKGTAPKDAPKSAPKVGPKKLTPQARLDMIIAIIKDNPLITREEIAKAVGVRHTTIQNDLRTLRKQYGLCYEGSSKTGQWVIDNKKNQ